MRRLFGRRLFSTITGTTERFSKRGLPGAAAIAAAAGLALPLASAQMYDNNNDWWSTEQADYGFWDGNNDYYDDDTDYGYEDTYDYDYGYYDNTYDPYDYGYDYDYDYDDEFYDTGYYNGENYEWEAGEGIHEEEWYDPSDWFDDDWGAGSGAGSTIDYETDWYETDYGTWDDDYGYDYYEYDDDYGYDYGYYGDGPYDGDYADYYDYDPGYWDSDWGTYDYENDYGYYEEYQDDESSSTADWGWWNEDDNPGSRSGERGWSTGDETWMDWSSGDWDRGNVSYGQYGDAYGTGEELEFDEDRYWLYNDYEYGYLRNWPTGEDDGTADRVWTDRNRMNRDRDYDYTTRYTDSYDGGYYGDRNWDSTSDRSMNRRSPQDFNPDYYIYYYDVDPRNRAAQQRQQDMQRRQFDSRRPQDMQRRQFDSRRPQDMQRRQSDNQRQQDMQRRQYPQSVQQYQQQQKRQQMQPEVRAGGTVQSISPANIRTRNNNLILDVRFENGRSVTTDFGPRMNRSNMPFSRGDELVIIGDRAKAGNRSLIKADDLLVDGRRVDLRRTSRDMQRNQQQAQRNQQGQWSPQTRQQQQQQPWQSGQDFSAGYFGPQQGQQYSQNRNQMQPKQQRQQQMRDEQARREYEQAMRDARQQVQGDQRQQPKQPKQQKQQSQQNLKVVRGTVSDVSNTNIGRTVGVNFAAIELEDGRTIYVQLERNTSASDLPLGSGDQLYIKGETRQLENRTVFVPHTSRMNNEDRVDGFAHRSKSSSRQGTSGGRN